MVQADPSKMKNLKGNFLQMWKRFQNESNPEPLNHCTEPRGNRSIEVYSSRLKSLDSSQNYGKLKGIQRNSGNLCGGERFCFDCVIRAATARLKLPRFDGFSFLFVPKKVGEAAGRNYM